MPIPEALADERAHLASETTTVDGHRIHYLTNREGPTLADDDRPALLALHGGIVDAGPVSWGGVASRLTDDYRVVVPDLLGYGDSAVPDVEYTIERHVRTMAGFVDDLGLADVAVCGLSLGGAVGLGLVLDTDAPVERLALIDSYGLGTDLPNGLLSWLLARVQVLNRVAIALFRRSRGLTKASLGGIAADPDRLDPAVVDAVWHYTKQGNAGVAFRSFRAHEITRRGYRTDFTPRLDAVDVPTLVVHGRHDEVVPVVWAERAAGRIPDSRLTILEDCAHWPTREDPDRVADLLRAFVSRDGSG